MKYILFYILILFAGLPLTAQGQLSSAIRSGMIPSEKNYTSFTTANRLLSPELIQGNSGCKDDPELGMLFAEAPCTDCYEIIGARTERTKKFVKSGTGGREIMLQSSTEPMHFKDESGKWRTVVTSLQRSKGGVYTASNQPVPVAISAIDGYTSIGEQGNGLMFNSNLELIYAASNGTERSLGIASWAQHTAGNDGVFVTDIWPGIDMEITVSRGAMKTNFYVRQAMPLYAAGKLLIRDHLLPGNGLQVFAAQKKDFKGNIEIRNAAGVVQYYIAAATAYEQHDVQHTLEMIGYNLAGNELDIVVPGSFLNRPAAAYPVVIDPLVSTATTSTVGGSSYSPANTVSCNYLNAATVPPNVKVTDVRWTFNYVASGGALLLNGAVDFTLGACRSPGVAGFFWYCNLASAGTCTGTNVSIFSEISPCIPVPQCPSYPLNLNMRFYQNYAATPPCATTYVTAGSPLTVTVFGRTVETGPVNSVGGLTSICLGQSVTLSTVAGFGVPPYSYLWNPGATSGNPVTLAPVATTSYSVTVTDACGQTATANQTIIVTPIAPITGSGVVCIGATTSLANSVAGGSWLSANGTVAVVGPLTGLVSGLTAGTTTISYVTPAGCYATTIVTVTPLPAAITGITRICAGNNVTLGSPTPGGTWASGNLAVAIAGAGTGVVTGVAPGTATITYTTSPGCTVTAVVTVNSNPVITSVAFTNPTTCGAADGTIILNGLVPGTVYTVDYTMSGSPFSLSLTANTSGMLKIVALTAGIYTGITVTSPEGCTATWTSSVTLVDMGTPPIPVAGNNSPICDGGTLTLTATSAPGVIYTWSGPGGFTSTEQNPVISPATTGAAGVYSVTATLLGCITLPGETTVIINPVPHIWGLQSTNPVRCGGAEGSITLEGLLPGVVYTIGYLRDGMVGSTTLTADGAGNISIYGLPAGTYSEIEATSLGCVSNIAGPITLTDPLAPPPPVIASNAPICVGLTLQLFGSNDKGGGTYEWHGPGGYTSNEQNPIILNVPASAQGVYTLTYTRLNCMSEATAEILLQPVIELTDVKAAKYVIAFGDSVQLFASGATFYNWTPHNGTIRDPYIFNPFVRPVDTISVYTVNGMNEWGCHDSAIITLRVVVDEDEFIPTAFSPNGDGKNDIFRIGKMKYKKLVDFTVYNRWGQEVYHNPYDINGGWDGTSGGKKQDVGVYFYSIIIENAAGRLKYYKGDVTLVR